MSKLKSATTLYLLVMIFSLYVNSVAVAASRVVTIGFSPCHTSAGATIPSDASHMVANAVDWVTDSSLPASTKVLILVDDILWNSGYAGSCEPDFIHDSLTYAGYTTIKVINEPMGGINKAALLKSDVIILSGESFEVNDAKTTASLLEAHVAGKGLVLIGDDVSWNKGSASSPTTTTANLFWRTLTRLKPIDNGQCLSTDTITIVDPAHPVMNGPYGVVNSMTTLPDCGSTPCTANDIDTTIPYSAVQILAESSLGNVAVSAWEAR